MTTRNVFAAMISSRERSSSPTWGEVPSPTKTKNFKRILTRGTGIKDVQCRITLPSSRTVFGWSEKKEAARERVPIETNSIRAAKVAVEVFHFATGTSCAPVRNAPRTKNNQLAVNDAAATTIALSAKGIYGAPRGNVITCYAFYRKIKFYSSRTKYQMPQTADGGQSEYGSSFSRSPIARAVPPAR